MWFELSGSAGGLARWERAAMDRRAWPSGYCGRWNSAVGARERALFQFGGDGGFAVGVDIDVDDVCATADGAVFDVLLLFTLREVDGDDDFFAAGAADVGGF